MSDDEVFDATAILTEVANRHGIRLSVLVAETGFWASPHVHRYLIEENGLGVFFPNTRRCRTSKGEKRGEIVAGVYLDDNSYANHAIKRAVGIPRERLIGFEACHIWRDTCYNEQYHTAIANLVLLPRALAGLSDHDPAIQQALQYRAYELYQGWYPAHVGIPIKPAGYPTQWREPMPFTEVVRKALTKRRLRT